VPTFKIARMKRYQIIISLLFWSLTSYGQSVNSTQGYILFHGIVMDAETQSPVPNADYIINRIAGGSSGEDGKFSFYVNRRDTVTFSSLGYQSTTLHISDTLKGREYVAGVYLNTDTVSIGEVIIVPRIGDLKTEVMLMKPETNQELINAKDNIKISVYQGLNSKSTLGNPYTNYELLKQRQTIEAYERGGIPSDQIAGISPLLLLPAAYMLMNGLPQKPKPPSPRVSDKELEQIRKIHKQLIFTSP
jgi:hypothetical protein